MKKFLMLITAMLCILCGALAFAACGETGGGNVIGGGSQTEQPGGEGTEGLQYQKRKDDAGNECLAVVGLGMAWETDIVIPAIYRGLPVKEIGESAFDASKDARNRSLTSISIPASVTSIGSSAFSGCSGLTEITIPDSVTSIGSSAFYYCSGLTSVTIGSGVTTIGGYAFESCSDLQSVIFRDPNGWSWGYYGEPIDPSSLQDPAVAANYLSKTYCNDSWTKTKED